MFLFSFLSAVITRALFILVPLLAVSRVTSVKENPYYWFLTFLLLPLVIEMIVTLIIQEGKDYKWFSPAIFLFLISIIPSIWILELHHQQNKASDDKCNHSVSWDDFGKILNVNTTSENLTFPDVFKNVNKVLCPDKWILALHQMLVILLIIGKWLLPLGDGVSRDQLSQLLLIFVGTAADILEFISETLKDVKDDNLPLVYTTLVIWTWSMLQFPCHLSVVKFMSKDGDDDGIQGDSMWSEFSPDLWSIIETLFIQDGPFLAVRITALASYHIFHQMLVFFAIKNTLVLILNFYRLAVLYQKFKSST